QDDSDAPDPEIARALDAWAPLAPPADFADRVVAARDAAAPEVRSPRWRVRLIGGVVLAGAAAAVAVLALRSPYRAASDTVIAARRTTIELGGRGTAVAEPDTEVVWRVADDGAAEITQRTGNVFYRVERGGPFVVHTPAGDVRVTGTCFRVEVQAMTPNQKLVIAGLAGAAIASTVLVTVYEGRVIAETGAARTELAAGSQATLRDRGQVIVDGAVVGSAADVARATREQLVVRTQAQQAELVRLRARVAQLEGSAVPDGQAWDVPEPGRVWHDPSPEKLAEWAATCHVRTDEPALDRFTPRTKPDVERGITAGELGDYNAAMTETLKRWKELTRSLYIEVTGDTVGADTLSNEAMRREIEEKSPRTEMNVVLQRISQERAGLAAPPADLSKTSALERLTRAYVQLGDQSEAALAKRLGAQRAHEIRGEGWGARYEMGGCPDPAGEH
ncbi:MAG TPA: FecR domain-containing protein, partial [Kofleriaceae bacterium]